MDTISHVKWPGKIREKFLSVNTSKQTTDMCKEFMDL